MRIARHKSKAYILAEILIGSVLQAAFIVSLAAGVYWLSMFSVRAHYLLLAREKGERIVAHIDNRIKTCGYGLWKSLEKGNLAAALAGTNSNTDLPIRIHGLTIETSPLISNDVMICGLSFSILYAKPTGIFISSKDNKPHELTIGEDTYLPYKMINYGNDDEALKKIQNNGDLTGQEAKISEGKQMLQSRAVISSVGVPLKLRNFTTTGNRPVNLQLIAGSPVMIPAIAELMSLHDEAFYFAGTNFCYKIMNEKIKNDYSQNYSTERPYVSDILRIFCEYHKKEKIFNLYILSSGGKRPAVLEMTQNLRICGVIMATTLSTEIFATLRARRGNCTIFRKN